MGAREGKRSMPKENTNCTVMDGFRAEVGWRRGDVQIATTNAHSTFKLPGDKPDDPEEPFYGWHVTLDRDGINKLINDLRRARDAAYGADA
jgi:hypothetical protein